jgi:hypothetical protein
MPDEDLHLADHARSQAHEGAPPCAPCTCPVLGAEGPAPSILGTKGPTTVSRVSWTTNQEARTLLESIA